MIITQIYIVKMSKALKGTNNPNYGKKPWNKGKKFK